MIHSMAHLIVGCQLFSHLQHEPTAALQVADHAAHLVAQMVSSVGIHLLKFSYQPFFLLKQFFYGPDFFRVDGSLYVMLALF